MILTERDCTVLKILRRYKFLTTAQIRSVCFPKDKDGSTTRDRLRKLEAAGYAGRRRAEVANPQTSNTIPVWMPTEQGCCALATRWDDMQYLLDHPINNSSWQNLAHYVEVSSLHLKMDQAIARQTWVKLQQTFFEHDIINPDADSPADRYRLHTVVSSSPKKIICAPDSPFEIEVNGFRRAFFVELERGTDSPKRILVKKHQGFHFLHKNQLFRKHFPQAHDMRVLMFSPTPRWRDALRKAARRKPGTEEFWLFCALSELTVESFLHGEIFWTVSGDSSRPFVRPVGSPASGEGDGEGEQGGTTGT